MGRKPMDNPGYRYHGTIPHALWRLVEADMEKLQVTKQTMINNIIAGYYGAQIVNKKWRIKDE